MSLASDQLFWWARWHGWKCSWVITCYRCYLAVGWEVNLSDLLRQHKGLNSKRGTRGQAGSRPSRAAPASHHLHTAAQPASLDITTPLRHGPLLSDKPHLHPSHVLLPLLISASDLSITQPQFHVTATLWPQLQMLLSFCRRPDFTNSWFLLSRPSNRNYFFVHL